MARTPKSRRATALWVTGRGQVALRDELLSAPGEGEALIRTLTSAVSRGTEALVCFGRIPESEYARMRCPFQSGDFPWPVKFGYAAVGMVEAGPAALVRRRVFCLHPHQDRFVVPIEALVPVPDEVPDARAPLAANLETALNAVWDGGFDTDVASTTRRRVAVVGAGLLGLFVARLVEPHAAVEIIEPDPERVSFARKLGFVAAPPAAATGNAEVVFEASGHPDGLAAALDLARFEATIVVLSWFGDRPVSLPLGGAFHSRRLVLKSSQVAAVAPAKRGQLTARGRLQRALALLADPWFDALIGERVAFDGLASALPRILSCPSTPPGVVITYSA